MGFKDLSYEEQMNFVNELNSFLKEKEPFIRSGECTRCGECCRTNEGKDCAKLYYDEENIPCCSIQENKPIECKDFPIYPVWSQYGHNADPSSSRFNKCGYTWQLNPKYTKQEIIDVLVDLCTNHCLKEDACLKSATIIANVEAELDANNT